MICLLYVHILHALSNDQENSFASFQMYGISAIFCSWSPNTYKKEANDHTGIIHRCNGSIACWGHVKYIPQGRAVVMQVLYVKASYTSEI